MQETMDLSPLEIQNLHLDGVSVKRVKDKTEVSVDATRATDQTMAAISKCHAIQKVRLSGLSGTRITKLGIRLLSGTKGLREVSISCASNFSPDLLEALSACTQLEDLVLVEAFPKARVYACLTNLVNLKHIAIAYSDNFTDEDLAALMFLPKLGTLELNHTQVSLSWPEAVRRSQSIRRARVRNKTWSMEFQRIGE